MAELELKRIIEAVLFASDAPVSTERIVEITGGSDGPLKAGRGKVSEALDELSAEYEQTDRAITISKVAGGWQLYCRPEYMKYARDLHKGRIPPRLSQAALETLAIVAYKQPLVRAEAEAIRGVDSSGVLATLLKRNLVTIAGRAPGMGRALMYRTTKEFLRYFGLNTITDLPRLEEFAEVLGLQPGELQMTVEGAEHMANLMSGAADGTDEAADAEATTGTKVVAGSELPVGAEVMAGTEVTAEMRAAAELQAAAETGAIAEAEAILEAGAPLDDVETETSPGADSPVFKPVTPGEESPAAPERTLEDPGDESDTTTVVADTEGAHDLGDAAIIQPVDEA